MKLAVKTEIIKVDLRGKDQNVAGRSAPQWKSSELNTVAWSTRNCGDMNMQEFGEE